MGYAWARHSNDFIKMGLISYDSERESPDGRHIFCELIKFAKGKFCITSIYQTGQHYADKKDRNFQRINQQIKKKPQNAKLFPDSYEIGYDNLQPSPVIQIIISLALRSKNFIGGLTLK